MAKRADVNKRKGRMSHKHNRNARIATKNGLIKRSEIKANNRISKKEKAK